MLVIHLQPISSSAIFNPREFGTNRESYNKDDVILLETDKGWMAVPVRKGNVKFKDVNIISKRVLTREEYDDLTNGEHKQFAPSIDKIADTSGTASADGFFMFLNWLIASLPIAQGSMFANYNAWQFTGIAMVTVPVIAGVVMPVMTMLRYRQLMKHWPNGSEVSNFVLTGFKSTLKYALGVLGWCIGSIISSIVIPMLFHSIGLASGVFLGPFGYIALAIGIGIGAGLGFAAYDVGSRVVKHFFERTPESKNHVGFFKNILAGLNPRSYHKKINHGDFDFKEMAIGALKEFATGFIGGIVWYLASLIPGGIAVIPVSAITSEIVMISIKVAAVMMATVAAILGSAAVSEIMTKFFSKPKIELSKKQQESVDIILTSLMVENREKSVLLSEVTQQIELQMAPNNSISSVELKESKSTAVVSGLGIFAQPAELTDVLSLKEKSPEREMLYRA